EWDESPGAVRPAEAEAPADATAVQPGAPAPPAEPDEHDTDDFDLPPVPAPSVSGETSTPPAESDLPQKPEEAPPDEPESVIHIPGGPRPELPRFESPAPVRVQAPRSEIDELLDEERRRLEPMPYYPDEEEERDRTGPGMWLLALAV